MDAATTRPTRTAVPRDRVAARRLPPLRDRPLHRRPRLVRRAVGEQLHVRAAASCSSRSARSTRASRCRAAATRTSSSTSGSARRPTSHVVTILGEGSFHQVHGGTTTNQTDPTNAARRSFGYAEHFAELRGRQFRGPGQDDPLRRHAWSPRRRAAREPRRMSTERVRRRAPAAGARRPADSPDADPRRAQVRRSSRRSGAACRGRGTTWLGRPIASAPDRPARVPGVIVSGAARLDHRDRHRRRRPRAVPRVDLRAARPRPGRVDRRRAPADDRARAPAASPTSTGSPRTPRPSTRCRRSSATSPRALVVLGSLAGTNLRIDARVRGVRAARARRLLRDRREHDRQRPSGVARRSARARSKR